MRVVTWNCRRATRHSALWRYLDELSPDVALLQEVSSLPAGLADEFSLLPARPITKTGSLQRFSSVVLVRGEILSEFELRSSLGWVTRELGRFAGNLPACRLALRSGVTLLAINVYSPAWPMALPDLSLHEIAPVKLKLNPRVWLADILWHALTSMNFLADEQMIIAGDFNLSETFDDWRGGPRGNREYLDRMAALGLHECLRESQGQLTPTFKNTNGQVLHQIDHVFANEILTHRLLGCATGSAARVFGESLSDHLPIIADFEDRR